MQFYVQSPDLGRKELDAIMEALGIEVLSYSQQHGFIVLSSPSAAFELRQRQVSVRVRKRPRKHKIHLSLRRLLRENPHAKGPVKLYAVLAAPSTDSGCDVETSETSLLAMELGAIPNSTCRIISGCKVAVEISPRGSVREAADRIAANPRIG